MILQAVYIYESQDEVSVRMIRDNIQAVRIPINDWREMGSPNEVSVTIATQLFRIGQEPK